MKKNFTQNFFLTRKKLEEQGLTFTKVSNTWYEGSSYKGINCNFKDNEGNIVELQFHTEKSLEVKEINHKLYEKQRLLKKGDPKILELEGEMKTNTTKIPSPKEIEVIKL